MVDGVTLINVDFRTGPQSYVGSIAADNEGTIRNCRATGTISVTPWIEGDGLVTDNDLVNIENVGNGELIPNKPQQFACDLNGNGIMDFAE